MYSFDVVVVVAFIAVVDSVIMYHSNCIVLFVLDDQPLQRASMCAEIGYDLINIFLQTYCNVPHSD